MCMPLYMCTTLTKGYLTITKYIVLRRYYAGIVMCYNNSNPSLKLTHRPHMFAIYRQTFVRPRDLTRTYT